MDDSNKSNDLAQLMTHFKSGLDAILAKHEANCKRITESEVLAKNAAVSHLRARANSLGKTAKQMSQKDRANAAAKDKSYRDKVYVDYGAVPKLEHDKSDTVLPLDKPSKVMNSEESMGKVKKSPKVKGLKKMGLNPKMPKGQGKSPSPSISGTVSKQMGSMTGVMGDSQAVGGVVKDEAHSKVSNLRMRASGAKKTEGKQAHFQEKIAENVKEMKESPDKYPGGKDQAIAIAAHQAGVSKK